MPFFVGQCILHMDLMAAIHIGAGGIFKVPVLYDYGRPSENLISIFRRPFLMCADSAAGGKARYNTGCP